MHELQVGVKVFLRDEVGRYLLLKRSDKYGSAVGEWDIVGGRIHPGTELLENLSREVHEETGMALASEPVLLGAQDILLNDRHVVRLTYTAVGKGELQLDLEEATQYCWKTKEEMMRLENLDRYARELLENNRIHQNLS